MPPTKRTYKGKEKVRSGLRAAGKVGLYKVPMGFRRVPDKVQPMDAQDCPGAIIRPVYLRGGRGPERKYWDEDISITGAATWQFDQDTEYKIVQGTTGTTRIGNHVTIKRISFRGKIRGSADNTDLQQLCRVALFLEKDNIGAASTYSSFFAADSLYSHRSMQVASTGDILFDRVVNLQVGSIGSAADEPCAYVQFSLPVNIPVNYVANAGAVTDVRGNHLSMGFIVDSPSGANFPVLSGKLRLTYVDS